jgi:hypothetical protein
MISFFVGSMVWIALHERLDASASPEIGQIAASGAVALFTGAFAAPAWLSRTRLYEFDFAMLGRMGSFLGRKWAEPANELQAMLTLILTSTLLGMSAFGYHPTLTQSLAGLVAAMAAIGALLISSMAVIVCFVVAFARAVTTKWPLNLVEAFD